MAGITRLPLKGVKERLVSCNERTMIFLQHASRTQFLVLVKLVLQMTEAGSNTYFHPLCNVDLLINPPP